jgi:ABC-type nitrate/sulfonate/bicarbonate transport system substrate-binding protein
MIEAHPDAVAAAVRALVKTQQALKADVSLATKVGRKLFPAEEAALIADVVARDLPYYDASVRREFVAGKVEFQMHMGLLKEPVAYEDVVATQFSQFWTP